MEDLCTPLLTCVKGGGTGPTQRSRQQPDQRTLVLPLEARRARRSCILERHRCLGRRGRSCSGNSLAGETQRHPQCQSMSVRYDVQQCLLGQLSSHKPAARPVACALAHAKWCMSYTSDIHHAVPSLLHVQMILHGHFTALTLGPEAPGTP